MADNLIEIIGKTLAGEMLNKVGSAIGASPQAAGGALAGAIPAILGGLLNKGSTQSGAGELLDMLTRGNHDGMLGNLAGALGGGDATSNLIKTGASLLPAIFGNRTDAIGSMIGSLGGLNQNSTKSLLGLLAPLVMGFVTKQLRGSGGLNLGNLVGMLAGQRDFIQKAAPAGLASALGVNSLGDIGAGLSGMTKAATPAASSGGGIWKWLIGLGVLALGFLLLRGCPQERAAAPEVSTPAPVTEVAPAPEPVVEATDGLIDQTLADGTVIRIAPEGVESKLIAFIQDANRAVDKTTWFTMDRMEFETGSATLKASSAAQLENITAILKAWPNVALKFGGYTDNTGDAAANVKLSGERANAAMQGVGSRGIEAGRLGAEGYGDQFPVADNATEEGRARNRRIDVRVSNK